MSDSKDCSSSPNGSIASGSSRRSSKSAKAIENLQKTNELILQAMQSNNAKFDELKKDSKAMESRINSKMEARDVRMQSKIEELKNEVKSGSRSGSAKFSETSKPPAPVPAEVGPVVEIDGMVNLTVVQASLPKDLAVLVPAQLDDKSNENDCPPVGVTARKALRGPKFTLLFSKQPIEMAGIELKAPPLQPLLPLFSAQPMPIIQPAESIF